MRDLLCTGRHGVRVTQAVGPWVSLGCHVHLWPLGDAHVDLHLGWWLITVGRTYGSNGGIT